MNTSRTPVLWFLVFLTLPDAGVAIASQGKAQLWSFVGGVSESDPDSAYAKASRDIDVDVTAFFDSSQELHLPLTLGRSAEVRFTEIERRSPRDFSWRGRVEDNLEGRAVFTYRNGFLHGQVFTASGAFFVGPKPDGRHYLEEIDQGQFRDCSGPLEPIVSTPSQPHTRGSESGIDPPGEIDLMVLYTEAALTAAGGADTMDAALQFAVDMANTAFADSQMEARLRVVHTGPAGRNETGNLDLDVTGLAADLEIAALRDTYSADLVQMIIEADPTLYAGCGIAYFMNEPGPDFENSAYSVSDRQCALKGTTLAHEIGHNLGLNHDPDNGPDPQDNSYPWSYGHWVDDMFLTVMSYYSSCSGDECIRVPNFSNPNVLLSGIPTGVGDQRDNHRSGNLTASIVANFRSAPACRVRLGSPNGRENLLRGTNNWIFWKTSGQECGDFISIELIRGGVVQEIIVGATANDGAFEWETPAGQAIGDDFRFRVSTNTTPTFSDLSDETFGIHEPAAWPTSRWVSHGPEGGSVEVLAIDPLSPQIVYAGITSGGVYRSTDGGATWTRRSEGLTNTRIRAIVVDPVDSSKLFAATWGGGIFRSTNGAESWTSANNGLENLHIYDLAADPQEPSILYAGGPIFSGSPFAASLFKSSNGGDHWVATGSGLPESSILSLAVDPTNSSIVFAGTWSEGLYKSTDGGVSWESSMPTLLTNWNWIRILRIAIDATNPSTIFASGIGTPAAPPFRGALFRSDDGGDSWAEAGGAIEFQFLALALSPDSSSTIYLSTVWRGILGYLFQSTDGGETWETSNQGLDHVLNWTCAPDPIAVLSLAVDPTNSSRLLAGTAGAGVFTSDDAGQTWSKSNQGLWASNVATLALDPWQSHVVIAGMSEWGGALFKSTDSSRNWKQIPFWRSAERIGDLAFDPSTPGVTYAGQMPSLSGAFNFESSLYRSSDGNEAWSDFGREILSWEDYQQIGPYPLIKAIAVSSQDSNRVFVGMEFGYTWMPDGLFRTDDGGLSWIRITDSLEPGGICWGYTPLFAVDLQDHDDIYTACGGGESKGEIHRSLDAGDSWQLVGQVTTTTSLTTIAVDPTDSETLYVGTLKELFKSSDGGSSWARADSGIGADWGGAIRIAAIAVNPFNPSVVCAGTTIEGVVCSVNGGETWFDLGPGQRLSQDVRSLVFDPYTPDLLYAGSMGAGVVRWEGPIVPPYFIFTDDFESGDTSAWSSSQ